MHQHDAALALMGLFQEGSADSSVADSVADELEFLTLGNDYVNWMDGIADVANGIVNAADGKVNLSKGCILLQSLVDDFDSNINWEANNEEEDAVIGTVSFHSSVEGHNRFSNGLSWVDWEEAYRMQ
jgi:hypothetical protein